MKKLLYLLRAKLLESLQSFSAGNIPPSDIDDSNDDSNDEDGENDVHYNLFCDGHLTVSAIQRNREIGIEEFKKASINSFENDKLRLFIYVDYMNYSGGLIEFYFSAYVYMGKLSDPETMRSQIIDIFKYEMYDKHDITHINFTEFNIEHEEGTI